jgi:copper transport protein
VGTIRGIESAACSRRAVPRALAACCACAWAVAFIFASSASAHAFPVSTTPQAGERLAAPPSEVSIHFSERVVLSAAQVTIRTPTGVTIPTGRIALSDADTTLHAPLVRPSSGIYVVNWSVTADDGHASAGEFAFAIGAVRGAIPAPVIRSRPIPLVESLATGLFLLGVSVAIGGLCSERFVWRTTVATDPAIPIAPVAAGLAIGLFGSAGQLVLLARAESAGIFAGTSWRATLESRPGILTAVALICVAYAFWILRVRRFRPFVLIPLVVAVVAAAFRGHSGVTAQWWTAPTNAIHFVLAALWVGALLHLVRVTRSVQAHERRNTLRAAPARYASTAIVVIPALLVSGIVTALGELDRLGDLVDTTYGVILLVKVGLVLAALAFALAARLWAVQPGHVHWVALRRLTGPEVVVLLVVIAVTGVLVSSAPPSPAATARYVLGPPPLHGPVVRSATFAGQLAVYLAAADGTLRVEVLAPGANAPTGAQIQVEARYPNGGNVGLYPRRCGTACATIAKTWPTGTTEITARISAPGWVGGNARFTVVWPPGQDAAAELARIVAAMRTQAKVRVHEEVSSGPPGGPVSGGGEFTGSDFLAQEPYANGGTTDVRSLPDQASLHRLDLSIPASNFWAEFWFEDAGRLARQLIINPGHRIKRTFEYPTAG